MQAIIDFQQGGLKDHEATEWLVHNWNNESYSDESLIGQELDSGQYIVKIMKVLQADESRG